MDHLEKEIVSKEDFQNNVVSAAKILYNPVCATLGPGGLPILIDRAEAQPILTKDGVTVANSIFVKDPKINAIVQSIKESSLKTNKIAGDGTTTAILFTYAIIQESQKYLKSGAINPQTLAKDLINVAVELNAIISRNAKKINDNPEAIKSVAKISANGDEEIASLVFESIDAVGLDGFVTLQESSNNETCLKIEEGFSINNGWASIGSHGNLLVNNKIMQEVVYENPFVFLIDGSVDSPIEFLQCLQKFTCNGQKDMCFVVLAHDFSPLTLSAIIQNYLQVGLKVLPIKIPKLGAQHSQSEVLQDIAILTSGKVFKPGENRVNEVESDPDNERSFLGQVNKVVCNRRETILYGNSGNEEALKERAEQLKIAMDEAFSEWEKGIIQQRLGRLMGGVAVIHIGGPTELEIKEKKDRCEDALRATRVALEEGIVAGGGSEILRAWKVFLKENIFDTDLIAIKIFDKVVRYPFFKILSNLGIDDDESLKKIMDIENLILEKDVGFDGYKREISHSMIQDGIIDPAKVLKTALQNATSIAAMLLSSGGGVICVNKKSSDIKDADFDNPLDHDV